MFSIDQNCHSLWDVVPKLQALGRHGHEVTHFVEDVDAAFTAIGGKADASGLRLARERFHHSGGADWGAALFYSEFLGRLPVDVRAWEPLTGMKTAALAKQLGRTPDDLYDEFSPSDNWQLIGSSYVGDREHHRIIADLTVAEAGPHLREILAKARADMLRRFPQRASQQRVTDWLDAEQQRVDRLLSEHADGRLVELYRHWTAEYVGDLPGVRLDLSSRLFALGADPARTALLEVFVRDYDAAAGLYNEALAETDTGLRPLKTAAGELPLFAAFEHAGHHVRAGVFLRHGALHVGGRSFGLSGDGGLPIRPLAEAGVRCLAGKAALLVIQVRVGPAGKSLVLPHRGSLYLPAAHRLADKLRRHKLLPGELKPVVRVRFRFLDRLKALETIIRLPAHLARHLGREEVPACVLGESYADAARAADERLESFRTDRGRLRWQQRNCPDLLAEIDALDRRRRELARTDPKGPEIREVWKRVKARQVRVLDATLRQIADDAQTRDLDYWDSRGALLPWSIALGGPAFYDGLLARAEIYPDPDGTAK